MENQYASLKSTLEQNIATGEALEIIYHAGSQPGSKRSIQPVTTKSDKFLARCLNSNLLRTFLYKKTEIFNNQEHTAPSYHKWLHKSFESYVIKNWETIRSTCWAFGYLVGFGDNNITVFQPSNKATKKHITLEKGSNSNQDLWLIRLKSGVPETANSLNDAIEVFETFLSELSPIENADPVQYYSPEACFKQVINQLWQPHNAEKKISLGSELILAIKGTNQINFKFNDDNWAYSIPFGIRESLGITYVPRKPRKLKPQHLLTPYEEAEQGGFGIWQQGPLISFKEGDYFSSKNGKTALQVQFGSRTYWDSELNKPDDGELSLKVFRQEDWKHTEIAELDITQIELLEILKSGLPDSILKLLY